MPNPRRTGVSQWSYKPSGEAQSISTSSKSISVGSYTTQKTLQSNYIPTSHQCNRRLIMTCLRNTSPSLDMSKQTLPPPATLPVAIVALRIVPPSRIRGCHIPHQRQPVGRYLGEGESSWRRLDCLGFTPRTCGQLSLCFTTITHSIKLLQIFPLLFSLCSRGLQKLFQ